MAKEATTLGLVASASLSDFDFFFLFFAFGIVEPSFLIPVMDRYHHMQFRISNKGNNIITLKHKSHIHLQKTFGKTTSKYKDFINRKSQYQQKEWNKIKTIEFCDVHTS